MLEAVVDALRCPHGEDELRLEGSGLVCPAGHRFDLARQGYVNLLTGPAPAAADTAAMVAARVDVQAAGHHAFVTDGLIRAVRSALEAARPDPGASDVAAPQAVEIADGIVDRVPPGLVVDLGAGTGHHLAAVVDALHARTGLALDVSKYAARRAARVHPRIGAVVADVWQPLPVRTGTVDVALDVFAPRNMAEIGRILAPGGVLVVVTPTSGHLSPLVERLGLLQVGADKLPTLDADLVDLAELVSREDLTATAELDRAGVQAMVAMGPSAHHLGAGDLATRVAGLPPTIGVTLAVTVSAYRRRSA